MSNAIQTPMMEIEQGEIIVNSVVQTLNTPRAIAYELDCKTKYAQALVGSSDKGFEVMLYANEDTLRKDENTNLPTFIKFRGFDPYEQRIQIFVDGGRYSWRITLIRPNINKIVWSSP